MWRLNSYTRWAINILVCIYAVFALLKHLIEAYYHSVDRTSWWSTEFLVNYQAGYVRRGLIGELLYQLRVHHNVDPQCMIWGICLVSFILLAGILVCCFRKANLCLWVLPLCTCLAGADFLRKDMLALLLIAGWLFVYSSRVNAVLKYIIINAITILLLNIHEASFFIFCPIVCFVLFVDRQKYKVCNLLTIFVCLFSFCIVVLHKGNDEIARGIQDSWAVYYPADFNGPLKTTIHSIGWETGETIMMHLNANFLIVSHGVQGWFSKPLAWLCTFFVIPNILFIKRSFSCRMEFDEMHNFLIVYIAQYLSLSPLFFVLSCDPVRILSYWTISSFLIYIFISDSVSRCAPVFVHNLVRNVRRVVFFKNSALIALVIMPFLCISYTGTDLVDAFSRSMVGMYRWAFCVMESTFF